MRLREAAVVPRTNTDINNNTIVAVHANGDSVEDADVDLNRLGTTLIIADHVLPLACVDDVNDEGVVEGISGVAESAENMLAPPPLLANLGKASANAYYMDMTVRTSIFFIRFHPS